MTNTKDYWFPAKRYGWGWGLPLVWQGWLVFAIALCLISAGVFLFPPEAQPVIFFGYTSGVVLLLVLVCWMKGEPPRWRWGK